eukprot:Plantae.Rhodophyta-Palmaria_palmata.ctg5236.p2 GENE.Plantae.Rhodophyta-Palmaria_palmata.ctg5236~~Plantae.Rhodophyta-Palmaria_palmata.ctg5236.p2  ORF type:complete len:109 (-),score=2.11 Plantae.Rhodophyta-Palmaria_palmata.ctg5236:1038-1364(-)
MECMMALTASLFFSMSWISVHPLHASTSTCRNWLPSTSFGVLGPVVSDEMAFKIAYLLLSLCLKGAWVAFLIVHGGHDYCVWLMPIFSMYSIAWGYSFLNHASVLSLA